MATQIANLEDAEDHDRDLPGSEPEPGSVERAGRLKEAVRLAGGPLAVAQLSGIPKGTIFSYQRGRDMRASAMIALARATGVRLDWLATGEGPMRAGAEAEQLAPPPAAPPASFRLFGQVKIDRLVDAYEGALAVTKGADRRLTMHLTVVLYDQISEAAETPPK